MDITDLRVERDVLAQSDDDLAWAVIEPAYDAVDIYNGPDAYDHTTSSLTAGQRALLALHWCVAEVSNGGFEQFFSNPTGIVAADAWECMRLIGAADFAAILHQAFAIFPNGSVPPSQGERETLLEAAGDSRLEVFERLEDEFFQGVDGLYTKAAAYVRSHPAEFIRS